MSLLKVLSLSLFASPFIIHQATTHILYGADSPYSWWINISLLFLSVMFFAIVFGTAIILGGAGGSGIQAMMLVMPFCSLFAIPFILMAFFNPSIENDVFLNGVKYLATFGAMQLGVLIVLIVVLFKFPETPDEIDAKTNDDEL